MNVLEYIFYDLVWFVLWVSLFLWGNFLLKLSDPSSIRLFAVITAIITFIIVILMMFLEYKIKERK